jgi:hypothetical protein
VPLSSIAQAVTKQRKTNRNAVQPRTAVWKNNQKERTRNASKKEISEGGAKTR